MGWDGHLHKCNSYIILLRIRGWFGFKKTVLNSDWKKTLVAYTVILQNFCNPLLFRHRTIFGKGTIHLFGAEKFW